MIILNAQGQTCNKFFTYLSYLGDSIETGEKIVVLSPDITFKYFPNLKNSKLLRFPLYIETVSNIVGYNFYIKALKYIIANKYSLRTLSILFKVIPGINFVVAPTNSNTSKNYLHHTEELKRLFTPQKEIMAEVGSVFNLIKKKHEIICGVHIRLGDYKTWQNGKYFYSLHQYHALMLNIKRIFPAKSISFFISSNEKIDYSIFSDCNYFPIPNSNAVKDLYGLSISDYIIGPRSTFSGWASYFGNKPLYFIENPNDEINIDSFRNILEIWK